MTTLSSSTMKSSAGERDILGGFDARCGLVDLVGVGFWISSIRCVLRRSSGLIVLSRLLIWRARLRLSASSLDDANFEARETIELQLEDGVGLLVVEAEPFMIFSAESAFPGLANDLDDFVERVENLLKAFEDVIRFLSRLELVFEAPRHDVETEVEEVGGASNEDEARRRRLPRFSVGTRDVRLNGRSSF